VFVKIGLIDENLSAVGRPEAAQRVEQRRFSRPAGAENSNELAWFRDKTSSHQDGAAATFFG